MSEAEVMSQGTLKESSLGPLQSKARTQAQHKGKSQGSWKLLPCPLLFPAASAKGRGDGKSRGEGTAPRILQWWERVREKVTHIGCPAHGEDSPEERINKEYYVMDNT